LVGKYLDTLVVLDYVFQTDDVKEDYSHLPPNQQKKNLLTKIEEVRQAIAKESNGR
jgi:hypothetical protein